eukprot:237733-Chlamydomonas_euryale.AAC.13
MESLVTVFFRQTAVPPSRLDQKNSLGVHVSRYAHAQAAAAPRPGVGSGSGSRVASGSPLTPG